MGNLRCDGPTNQILRLWSCERKSEPHSLPAQAQNPEGAIHGSPGSALFLRLVAPAGFLIQCSLGLFFQQGFDIMATDIGWSAPELRGIEPEKN